MFPSGSRYNWSVIGLMAIYTVLCFAVPEFLQAREWRGPLGILVGAAPAYPIAIVFWLYVKELGGLDELEQRIQLLALALGAGILLIGSTAYGFVSLHLGYPEFPAILHLPVFVVLWCGASFWIKRSYR